jgi:hypothetical protein
VYVIEIIVFRAENLRALALIKKMAGSSGEPTNKLFLVPWKVLLVMLSNNQSIGISKSSAALFIVYSHDICDYNDRIIRISKVKLGAILQIGSLIIQEYSSSKVFLLAQLKKKRDPRIDSYRSGILTCRILIERFYCR